MTSSDGSRPFRRGIRAGPRGIGAIAGLVPALLVLGLFVVMGAGPSGAGFVLAIGGIFLSAVIFGWLVGPLAKGTFRSDLAALLGYAALAGVVYLVVGSVRAFVDTPGAEGTSLLERLLLIAARFAYGILYLPFWTAYAAPFALGWIVAVRVLRRRAGVQWAPAARPIDTKRSERVGSVRPRRMSLFAGVIIVVYSLFVVTIPLTQNEPPRSPWWLERPVALLGLFVVPAVVAGIGAVRGVRPLLIAAGVLCLMQAYIAFSGVTIGFVAPGLLLLILGSAERWPNAPRVTRTTLLAGVAVIALTFGAWISLLGLTAPRCYAFSEARDGTRVYTELPTAGRISVDNGVTSGSESLSGPVAIAGSGEGCSSAELTPQGIGTAARLAIGAIALAALAASSASRSESA